MTTLELVFLPSFSEKPPFYKKECQTLGLCYEAIWYLFRALQKRVAEGVSTT